MNAVVEDAAVVGFAVTMVMMMMVVMMIERVVLRIYPEMLNGTG